MFRSSKWRRSQKQLIHFFFNFSTLRSVSKAPDTKKDFYFDVYIILNQIEFTILSNDHMHMSGIERSIVVLSQPK